MSTVDKSNEINGKAKSSRKELVSAIVITLGCLIGTVILIPFGFLIAMAGGMAAGSNAGDPNVNFYNVMAFSPCVFVPVLLVLGVVGAIWIYRRINK